VKVLLSQFRKPATETRFYDRIGRSLSIIFPVEVASAGAILKARKSESLYPIRLLPVFKRGNSIVIIFKNLGLLMDLLNRERPDLLIICNPEAAFLLPLVRTLMPGMKIVFDLQENHSLNLLKQKHLDSGRLLPAAAADFLIWLACRFADRIWLAETIYKSQMRIPASKSICLENKPGLFQMENTEEVNPYLFSFTGFISRESGILRAIRFILQLRSHHPEYRLQICGYCPEEALVKEILSYPFIEYAYPDSWASEQTILSCLTSSCGMLMPYEETEANSGKTPSKWFLARAAGVPVLYDSKTALNLPDQSAIGFAVDFDNPDPTFFSAWKKFREEFRQLPSSSEHFFADDLIRDEMLRLFGPSFSKR
jgi:hypothetical protein